MWPLLLTVAVVILAFAYIAGPEIYRRAMMFVPHQGPTANGFTQEQVDAKVAGAVANLNAQLVEITRQRDAAQREANALRQQIQNAPPPQQNLDTPRSYTKLSIPEIRAIYEGRTPLQGDILFADEVGKWINTDGTIQNVLSGGLVVLRKDDKGIQCVFDRSWWSKLSVLRQNDNIKVAGKLAASQNPHMITLASCEIRG